MKQFLYFTLTSFFVVSCTGGQALGLRGFETRQSEEFYQNSGVVQYFLSELPAWANSYQDGACQRTSSVRYLNLKSLRESYRYSYSDALQFQYLYNQLMREKIESVAINVLRPQDEELIFFETSNRIQSDFFPFRRPEFKSVSLIWVDPLLKKKKNALTKLLEREDVMQGHPVLISNCLVAPELRAWLAAAGIYNENIRLIPAEMFSPYDEKSNLLPALGIEVKELFLKDQKLNFFVPKNKVPSTIRGKVHYKYY